jgi:hypothetical protein
VPRPDADLPIHPLSWRSWHFRGFAALFLAVFVVRVLWGHHARAARRSEMDGIRHAGDPASVADVVIERVPESQNAWEVQVQAAQATRTNVSSPRASNDEFRGYPPFPDAWMKRASDSEKAHGQAFALARQARQLTRVQLRDRVTSPLAANFIGSYGPIRNLGNTVSDGALFKHVGGDDDEALERVMDVLHVARSPYTDPFPISQLVGRGIDALALNTTQAMAPGLRLNAPATRRRVVGLVAQLLDEEPCWRGLDASLRMARLETTDLVEWRSRGVWFIRPAADLEIARNVREFDAVIEAGRQRSYPRTMAVYPKSNLEFDPVSGDVPQYSRWFHNELAYVSRYLSTQYRTIAERRVTAVSLAAQLYRADHGRWPEKLDELAPAYLPAVPADPYHEDGRPLGYVIKRGALPGGGDRPLVYFDAGEDDPAQVGAGPMYGWFAPRGLIVRSDVARQYRDLARFEPRLD